MSENTKKAAKWWRDQIESGAMGDAGLSGRSAILSGLRQTGTTTPDALDAFEIALAEAIQVEEDSGNRYIIVKADYDPCDMLRGAAAKAGLLLAHNGWPYKTRCVITPDGVRACDGYGRGWFDVG